LIDEHANSDEHRRAVLAWMKRSTGSACIDSDLRQQVDAERKYWHSVLLRVVEVVKFLAERGLAFRGDNELLGSSHNGNFLGFLELLAKFDSFLADHISRYGGQGRGFPSYLSSTICDEIIDLMGKEVLQVVCNEIRNAKYFALMVDSTPDTSHIDQLTIVMRFANDDGEVVERFLKFVPIDRHTGESLRDHILQTLKDLNIDIQNYRGQSYDNAANMSGKYSGLQSRIKEENRLADYVPCAAHSLNLVGTASVNCCIEAVSFFGIVQQIYAFAAGSPHRWNALTQGLSKNESGRILTLKTLSSTRWHCHAESVKALSQNYLNFYNALSVLADDDNEPAETRITATNLAASLQKLETAFLCELWFRILKKFNRSSSMLQNTEIHFLQATAIYNSLQIYITELRKQFTDIDAVAKNMMPNVSQIYVSETARVRRRPPRYDDSTTPHIDLSGTDSFRVNTFIVIIDQLHASLEQRHNAYQKLSSDFAFLEAIADNDAMKLRTDIARLIAKYPSDLENSCEEEFVHFMEFITQTDCARAPNQMLKYIKQHLLVESSFPNVCVALRIYLTLPVTVCEGERSFSKLSLIKNVRRSSMHQSRLNALAIMSIEHDVTRSLTFDSVIELFSSNKARKKMF
jgi:hypothetical protein